MTVRRLSILLVCAGLATSPGCQVLGIPSYRTEMHASGLPPTGFVAETELFDNGGSCSDLGESACSELEGAPRVLPPLPGWLASWRAKKQLPDPPDYPRFHPLPTRPMFSPAANSDMHSGYGDLPSPEGW